MVIPISYKNPINSYLLFPRLEQRKTKEGFEGEVIPQQRDKLETHIGRCAIRESWRERRVCTRCRDETVAGGHLGTTGK